jgi:predicted Zn-dependent protease with MMP-like domain
MVSWHAPFQLRPAGVCNVHHDQLPHDQFTHAGENRDYFALYRQHVLAYSRNEVVLDILNHTVVQKTEQVSSKRLN